MNFLVYLVISLLIITKLMDVLSTMIRIKHPQIETNPLARRMMNKIGIKTTAWIVFAIVGIIVLIMGGIALTSEKSYQIFFWPSDLLYPLSNLRWLIITGPGDPISLPGWC